MAELLKEYEGTWEEILTHSQELAGHQVQLKVMEPEPETLTKQQRMMAAWEAFQKVEWTPEEQEVIDGFEEFNHKHPIDFSWSGDDK